MTEEDGCNRISSLAHRAGVGDRNGVLRQSLVPLAAIGVVAGGLRLIQIHESLWLDELHTAWTVAGGWGDVGWRAAIGNQSPPYFYLVKAATSLFGLNEVAVRLPSALAGTALVVAAGWLVTRWSGSRVAGLLAAGLLTVDPHSLFYAQEARPYALVQLLGLLQIALFVRLLGRPDRWTRGWWIAAGWGPVYLHYTAILLIPAQLLAFTILQLRRNWRPDYRWRQLALDLAVFAAGCLPALPQVLRIAHHRDAWSLFIPRDVPAISILTLFPLEIYLLLPAAICLLAAAARWIRGAVARDRPVPGEPRDAAGGRLAAAVTVVAGCWLLVPPTLAWFATAGDWARLFFLRYVIVSAAASAVLGGLVIALCPGRHARGLAAAVVLAVAIWQAGLVDQFLRDGRLIGSRQQSWRAAVAYLQPLAANSSEPVFVRSGLIEADRLRDGAEPRLVEYCLLPVQGIYRLNIPRERLIPLPTTRSGQLDPQQVQAVQAAGGAWFLLCGNPRTVDQIAQRLLQVLSRSGPRAAVAQRQQFANVAVLRVELE